MTNNTRDSILKFYELSKPHSSDDQRWSKISTQALEGSTLSLPELYLEYVKVCENLERAQDVVRGCIRQQREDGVTIMRLMKKIDDLENKCVK